MQGIRQIRAEILELLRSDSRFAGIAVTGEYGGGRRNLPVTGTELAVGIERVELAPGALGSRPAPGVQAHAEITLRFDCFWPRDRELPGYFADDLYELMLSAGAERLWCEAVRPEPAAMANHLRVFAALSVLLGDEAEERPVSEIVVKRK